MLEVDYIAKIDKYRQSHGGSFFSFHATNCVIRNNKLLGSLEELIPIAINEYGIDDAEIANTKAFDRESVSKTLELLKQSGHDAVFLEYYQGEDVFGKIVVELFSDICPRACENFIKLCTGECGVRNEVALFYKDSPIHRVVPNGWVQGGDIVDGSGNNSVSAFEKPVEDESFSVEFDSKFGGIVGYSSSGPHSNGSQYFITLGACEWMNCTKVGFGRVVQGYGVLKKLNAVKCNNQRPEQPIFVGACGKMKLE